MKRIRLILKHPLSFIQELLMSDNELYAKEYFGYKSLFFTCKKTGRKIPRK